MSWHSPQRCSWFLPPASQPELRSQRLRGRMIRRSRPLALAFLPPCPPLAARSDLGPRRSAA
uniref:Uncharacterized protein n=1 Tax=Arundo donax TaxID=35708 RepID=A0A0A9ABC1_ARUDO